MDRTDAEMISGLVTYLEGIRHCGPVICELC